jgi:hypothetical protein
VLYHLSHSPVLPVLVLNVTSITWTLNPVPHLSPYLLLACLAFRLVTVKLSYSESAGSVEEMGDEQVLGGAAEQTLGF